MEMNIFNIYSEYYNLLYKDKNYTKEAEYISDIIRRYNPESSSLLNLGCGTGKHDFLFANKGFNVTGIDISGQMLKMAEADKTKLKIRNVKFIKTDIRKLDLKTEFDSVISLFHVISYLNSNQEIKNVLASVYKHLKDKGIFIFDFWYGPAVVAIKPTIRVKRMENKSYQITRIAEPDIDYNRNVVKVNYELFIKNKKTKEISEIKETHSMRYFYEPELAVFLKTNHFRLLESREWLTNSSPGCNTWNAMIVCQKDIAKEGVS